MKQKHDLPVLFTAEALPLNQNASHSANHNCCNILSPFLTFKIRIHIQNVVFGMMQTLEIL